MDVEKLRRVDPGYRAQKTKIKFSKTELVHILLAVIVLTAAFSIMLFRGSNLVEVEGAEMTILIALVLVVCSFLAHEFGHKFVAQHYNAWSEFRAYPFGLLIALPMALFGILFAAPGAVYIEGNIDKEQNGKISLAGPGVNFILAAIAIVCCSFFTPGSLEYFVFMELAWLNSFLGLFNMIPILPFDGSKIVAWSIPVFAVCAIIGILELIFVYTQLI